MAETFDTAGRLDDGATSVADIQSYVTACHALGYDHPDLTSHPAQVHDRYTSEAGMDLRALDADCVALQAVCARAEEALTRQDAARTTLATAWQGAGALASRHFLARHDEASVQAVTAARSAVHAVADLRDRLWQAVDAKVAAVLAVDDAAQARRGEWLAAAQTVTTGAGDQAVASELVDQEVKPFVATVIGGQWLAAVRAATDAIEAAYDAANAELAARSPAVFGVPGELGPVWTGSAEPVAPGGTTGTSVVPPASPPVGAAPVAPASWGGPAAAPGSWGAPAASAPSAATPPPSAPFAPPPAGPGAGMAAPPMPSLSGGGGMPDIGSGLSGLGQQLGDLFGGLWGATEDGPLDGDSPLEGEQPDELDGFDGDELEDDDPEAEPGEELSEEADEAGESVDPAAVDDCPPPPAEPADAPPPEPPPATPPPQPAEPAPAPLVAVPAPPADPVAGSGTPCEIAADELPQVGE